MVTESMIRGTPCRWLGRRYGASPRDRDILNTHIIPIYTHYELQKDVEHCVKTNYKHNIIVSSKCADFIRLQCYRHGHERRLVQINKIIYNHENLILYFVQFSRVIWCPVYIAI